MSISTQHNKLRITTGFTLVELVVVILIISILAIAAYSRFQDRTGYSEFTYQARFISAARNVQQRAMQDTRVNQCYQININTGSSPAFGLPPLDSFACASPNLGNIDFNNTNDPTDFLATSAAEMSGEGVTITVTNNANVNISNSVNFFRFSALGVPSYDSGVSCAAGCRVQFTGAQTATVCIESQGFIHAC